VRTDWRWRPSKALAELIVTGRSDVDLHPLRPARFRENDLQEDLVAL
jgi:hypothetical protein